MSDYLPQAYWGHRLGRWFDLRGTGHLEHSLFYNRWLYRAKARAIQTALRITGRTLPGASVLDAGAGIGFFVDLYHRWGAARIAGVDITLESVRHVRKAFPFASIWHADIAAEIPTDEVFDIVQSLDVLYHLPDERFTPALMNLVRRTRPAGLLLVSDGLRDAHPAAHVFFRTRAAYARVLNAAGAMVIGEVPIYRFLNRGRSWAGQTVWRLLVGACADTAAPLLYLMDRIAMRPDNANLFLLVCRREET